MLLNLNETEKDVIKYNDAIITPKRQREGNPLTQSSVQDMVNNFNLSYKFGFMNNGVSELINKDIFNFNLKIKVETIKAFLSIDNIYNLDHGAAFYYIIYIDSQNREFFTYAVTPAKYDSTTKKVTPKVNSQGEFEYLVFTPDNIVTGHKINQTEFQTYRNAYINKVEIREFTINDTVKTTDITSLTNEEHPTNCYYSDQQIYFFEKDNSSIPINQNNFYLNLFNGAIYKEYKFNGKIYNFKVQTPILIFEYDSSIISSDRVFDPQKPYYYKALDVGRLCPPQCD